MILLFDECGIKIVSYNRKIRARVYILFFKLNIFYCNKGLETIYKKNIRLSLP